jgi:uncharacterized protein YtpQ (UPF0354 family)
MAGPPIFTRSQWHSLLFILPLCACVCSCTAPVKEAVQPAVRKLKIEQQPLPDIVDSQKGLPSNIFDERLEAKDLDEKQFTEVYSNALQALMPKSRVRIQAPLAISIRVDRHDQQDCKIDLKSLWQRCKDKPGHRQEIIAPVVKSFLSMFNFVNQPLAGEEFIDKIVPLVRSQRFIEAIKPQYGNDFYNEKTFADLYIVYGIDDPKVTKILNQDYLTNYAKIRPEALKSLSLSNLERLVARNIYIRADGPIFIVTAGGDYEPSLLLLDKVVRDFQKSVKGRLVAAIPARDALFICGDETPGALEKLRDVAERARAKAKLPISDKLFIRDQGEWKVFKAFDSQ